MSDDSDPIDKPTRRDDTSVRPRLRWLKIPVVLVAVGLLLGLFVMWLADARYEARKVQFVNNLKQVGLAAHNFHDVHVHFPPPPSDGSEYPEVTQPVSFHAISFVFVQANSLFEQIDMTIPWDAPENRDEYETDIPVYLSPMYGIVKSPGGYGGALLVPNSRLMPHGVGLPLGDIIDGAGTTILAGGIDDAAVPAWGNPQNDRDAAEGFGGGSEAFGGLPEEGGSLVLFSDGHVDEFDAETNALIAKALATPAGGDSVTDSNLRP